MDDDEIVDRLELVMGLIEDGADYRIHQPEIDEAYSELDELVGKLEDER